MSSQLHNSNLIEIPQSLDVTNSFYANVSIIFITDQLITITFLRETRIQRCCVL